MTTNDPPLRPLHFRPRARDTFSSEEVREKNTAKRNILKDKMILRLTGAGFTIEQASELVERFSGIYQNADLDDKEEFKRVSSRPRKLFEQTIRQQKKLRDKLKSFGFKWPEIYNLMNAFYEYVPPTELGKVKRPYEGDEFFNTLYERSDSPGDMRNLMKTFYSPVATNRRDARAFYNMILGDKIAVTGTTWQEDNPQGYKQWRKFQRK